MNTDDDKLADLDKLIRKQDADHEARMAEITKETTMPDSTLDETDADRPLLLDRLAERMPDLDLSQHKVEWTKLPDDGSEALVIDGGGFDGGNGYFIANSPDDSGDLHVVGPTAPLVSGKIGCVLIHADGTRELARLIPDPLTEGNGGDVEQTIVYRPRKLSAQWSRSKRAPPTVAAVATSNAIAAHTM